MDGALVEDAWWIEERFGLHVWDAQIVAAARAAACRYLLTEDLRSGQDVGAVRVVDPFAILPQELPAGP